MGFIFFASPGILLLTMAKIEVQGAHIDWGNFQFPSYLSNSLCTASIWRGRWPKGDPHGYTLHFWDHVRRCVDVDCPLRPCRYYTARATTGCSQYYTLKRCLMQKYYLKAIVADGLQLIERSGIDWDKIALLGFHLLPLYNQLWLHKMEILRLDGWSRDPDAPERAHPVYKEFRATHRDILKVWDRLARRKKGGRQVTLSNKKTDYIDALLGKPAGSRRTRHSASEEGTGMRWD